jgi:antitoxin (DNA-binding transcriptional repressor) of toxin-antitoxin stability system
MSVTVGVRKFRENLRHYLDLVRDGTETVVVTDRGKAIAELHGPSNLQRLIDEGLVRPAKRPKRPVRTEDLIEIDGPPWLSDVVIADRRHER